jgi:hypothetical protein
MQSFLVEMGSQELFAWVDIKSQSSQVAGITGYLLFFNFLFILLPCKPHAVFWYFRGCISQMFFFL